MLKLYHHTRRASLSSFLTRTFERSLAHLFPILFVSPFIHQNANIPTTQGFDEFMNVVLDEAAEVYVKEAKPRRELGV